MVRASLAAAVLVTSLLSAETASARPGAASAEAKPWCGPDVSSLSDHVCYVDGASSASTATRRTLVIYLHGVLAKTPGFQYVQQRWMAQEARSNGFTLLMPTAPDEGALYAWPGTAKALEKKEAAVLDGIQKARAELEKRAGAWMKPGDEGVTRAPVFVGVSAADPGSAAHSRGFASERTRYALSACDPLVGMTADAAGGWLASIVARFNISTAC